MQDGNPRSLFIELHRPFKFYAEELVVRGAEQVGDGRQVVVAVAELRRSNESRRARAISD